MKSHKHKNSATPIVAIASNRSVVHEIPNGRIIATIIKKKVDGKRGTETILLEIHRRVQDNDQLKKRMYEIVSCEISKKSLVELCKEILELIS